MNIKIYEKNTTMGPPGSPRGPLLGPPGDPRSLRLGSLRPSPLGPPWGPPPGAPPGAPFPGKKIRGFAANIFFRLHDRGGPMGPQIYDLYVLYT